MGEEYLEKLRKEQAEPKVKNKSALEQYQENYPNLSFKRRLTPVEQFNKDF